jgi:hypothetical protein
MLITKTYPFLSFVLILLLLLSSHFVFADSQKLSDPFEAGWKGSKVCEKLSENKINRILRCTFPPGVGHERHFHVAHFGYALSGGTVRITDHKGTREVTLSTDSSYSSNGVEWHQIENIGETTVIYLIIENKPM